MVGLTTPGKSARSMGPGPTFDGAVICMDRDILPLTQRGLFTMVVQEKEDSCSVLY